MVLCIASILSLCHRAALEEEAIQSVWFGATGGAGGAENFARIPRRKSDNDGRLMWQGRAAWRRLSDV